jgi:small subunit ribosomal protein S21e
MEGGRQQNMEVRMKGCINDKHKLTDIYLPRKCDYTDRMITPKDRSSVQLTICDVNEDGSINLANPTTITLCGFVRCTGQSDVALDKVMREKNII